MGGNKSIASHLLYCSGVAANHDRNLESVHIVLNRSCSLGERNFCVSHSLLSVTLPALRFAQGGAECTPVLLTRVCRTTLFYQCLTNILFFALRANSLAGV